MTSTSISELNEKMKKFSQEFSQSLERKDFDHALKLSIEILEELILIAREDIVSILQDPYVKSIADDIIKGYEKSLSYVKGIIEGLKYVSPIYSIGEKERLVQVVASSINELFSFIMGALIIVAELSSSNKRENRGITPGGV